MPAGRRKETFLKASYKAGRPWLSLVMAGLLALALAACGDNTATTPPAATTGAVTAQAATTGTTAASGSGPVVYPLSLTDDSKRAVKLDKAPAKIVSLAPSNTEL